MAVPYETKVRIYSDSKAAIEGIQNSKGIMSIRSHFKIKNRSLISQILDCCNTKKLDLELTKVKRHSMNIWNDKADKLAKEGLSSCIGIEVQELMMGRIGITPKWKDKTIDSPLRSFVNLTVVTAYETAWADLNSIRPVLNQRDSDQSNEQLNWKNTWAVLKKLQGKRCTSMIRSKTLIFRIKCLNKLLPTKDISFQRDPALYESKTCIACFVSEETLEHLAECQIYQRI